jgi:hypothetical protein
MEEWVKIILIEENEEMFDEIKYELINDGIEMLTELIIGDKPNLTDMMNKYGLLIYNMEHLTTRLNYMKMYEKYGQNIRPKNKEEYFEFWKDCPYVNDKTVNENFRYQWCIIMFSRWLMDDKEKEYYYM